MSHEADELGDDPYAIVESESFKNAVKAMADHEKLHPRAPLDALLLTAWPYLFPKSSKQHSDIHEEVKE